MFEQLKSFGLPKGGNEKWKKIEQNDCDRRNKCNRRESSYKRPKHGKTLHRTTELFIIRVTNLLSISTFNFIRARAVGYHREPFDKNVMNFLHIISYIIINFKLVTRKRNKNRKEKSNATTCKRSMMYYDSRSGRII